MHNLLSANLSRLWLNKGFWASIILMIFTEGFFCFLLLIQGPIPIDSLLFISLQGIGIVTSVFLSLLLGTEYSDGTIRNKLISGHKRGSIYLASFLTGIIAVTILYLSGVLTGSVFGMIWYTSPNYQIGQIAIAGIIGWMACVSYISIFHLIGMLSSSKARTSIINILTAFILLFAGLLCCSLARPGLLPDSKRIIYQFLFELNPLGQTFYAMFIDIPSPWKLAAYSLLLSSVLTGLGIFIFCKKDLK